MLQALALFSQEAISSELLGKDVQVVHCTPEETPFITVEASCRGPDGSFLKVGYTCKMYSSTPSL